MTARTTQDRARRNRKLRLRTAICCLSISALALAACASDDSGDGASDTGGNTESVDAAEILGRENPATGEPLRIGFVYDGATDVVDTTPQLVTAEAAAKYVNDYLGGVSGRPIELDVCSTDLTPSGASECVAQMARDGVPIALNGSTGQAADLIGPMAEAGVPMFITSAGDAAALSTPGIYVMANGLVGILGGPATLAADAGVERSVMITIDVPAASGLLEEAAPIFYGDVGVEVDVVTVPPETPDMTPQVQAALSEDPGQFMVVGDGAFCAKAMDALAAVGYTDQIVVLPTCLDDASLDTVTNWEGVEVLAANTTDPDSEEFQLYTAVMDTYADADAERDGGAVWGYQAVVGFARAMAGLTGDVSPESIEAAFAAMEPTPMPLADGVTYQCDGQQVELAPNFCSIDILLTTLDAEGQGTEFTVFQGDDLIGIGRSI